MCRVGGSQGAIDSPPGIPIPPTAKQDCSCGGPGGGGAHTASQRLRVMGLVAIFNSGAQPNFRAQHFAAHWVQATQRHPGDPVCTAPLARASRSSAAAAAAAAGRLSWQLHCSPRAAALGSRPGGPVWTLGHHRPPD